MKIGIITFQLAWNCGAVLQCAALQRKLEEWGHEVCIINYRPDYKKNKYRKYQNLILTAADTYKDNGHLSFCKRIKKSIKSTGRALLNYKASSGRLKQYRDFNYFCEKYLNLTRVYTSIEDLKINPPDCDLYITGSDQLWNPKLTDRRLDEAYFLDFGNEQTRRISYAVSACELDINKYGKTLKNLCGKLDMISLRESEMKTQFENLLNRNVNVCIDPTLLLPAEKYEDMEYTGDLQSDKYILVYALDNPGSDEVLFKTVKRLKEDKKLPVMMISGPRKWEHEIVAYTPQDGISPGEFLSYIKNAEIVVTNSFHAAAFSIIYKKEFYAALTPGRGARVTELLRKVKLTERIPKLKNGDIILSDKKIDYNMVFENIEPYRRESEEYLKLNLGG